MIRLGRRSRCVGIVVCAGEKSFLRSRAPSLRRPTDIGWLRWGPEQELIYVKLDFQIPICCGFMANYKR